MAENETKHPALILRCGEFVLAMPINSEGVQVGPLREIELSGYEPEGQS